MQYTFKCPACGHVLTVSAPDRNTAIDEMMKKGEEHSSLVHAGMPMDPAQMRQMVETQMQEEAGASSEQQVASMSAPMPETTLPSTPIESGSTPSPTMDPTMSETPTSAPMESGPVSTPADTGSVVSSVTTAEPTNDGTNQGGGTGGIV